MGVISFRLSDDDEQFLTGNNINIGLQCKDYATFMVKKLKEEAKPIEKQVNNAEIIVNKEEIQLKPFDEWGLPVNKSQRDLNTW